MPPSISKNYMTQRRSGAGKEERQGDRHVNAEITGAGLMPSPPFRKNLEGKYRNGRWSVGVREQVATSQHANISQGEEMVQD